MREKSKALIIKINQLKFQYLIINLVYSKQLSLTLKSNRIYIKQYINLNKLKFYQLARGGERGVKTNKRQKKDKNLLKKEFDYRIKFLFRNWNCKN